jgi:hypothetical protein
LVVVSGLEVRIMDKLEVATDFGYFCFCCGHKNFKKGPAWCDYCFLKLIETNGAHSCKVDKLV